MTHDIIIVGGGIVGLATALKLLEKKPALKLLVIEKEDAICKHQTGNNSGVIHSGIYYKPGSLKALNCINGYNMLLKFCRENDVKFEICGKVIVAVTEDELPSMNNIYERGVANGLADLRKISAGELKEIEPHVSGVAGVIVPQTGIIDYTEVAEKYVEKIKSFGGTLNLNETVLDIKINNSECEVITNKQTYKTKNVISCGGLQSDRIALKTNPDLDLRIIPFRGEYYKLRKEKNYLVKSLIYPVPDPAFPFLGVHFTRMIDGSVEAGPNAVLAFKREGYTKTSFNFKDAVETLTWPGFQKVMAKYWRTGFGEFYRSYSKTAFVKALQRLIPEINEGDLEPGGAGIRAQACSRTGGLVDDFNIVENNHVWHVCNAPSPAATASLSIGDYISGKVISKIS